MHWRPGMLAWDMVYHYTSIWEEALDHVHPSDIGNTQPVLTPKISPHSLLASWWRYSLWHNEEIEATELVNWTLEKTNENVIFTREGCITTIKPHHSQRVNQKVNHLYLPPNSSYKMKIKMEIPPLGSGKARALKKWVIQASDKNNTANCELSWREITPLTLPLFSHCLCHSADLFFLWHHLVSSPTCLI